MTADGRRLEDRVTARVLLIEPTGRVLLIEDSDPGAPGAPTFWMTPGGALDPGETPAEAALREVQEETGLVLPASALSPPLGERRIRHGYSDRVVEQREVFFAALVEPFEWSHDGLTEDERATVQGMRWWTAEELESTTAMVWPVGLAALVRRLASGDLSVWTEPLSSVEESTVAVATVVPQQRTGVGTPP